MFNVVSSEILPKISRENMKKDKIMLFYFVI